MIEELQRTNEWFNRRLGKVTASEVYKVMAKGKGGSESLTRASYCEQLVIERLTNMQTASYSNPAMDRGRELEASARMVYEFETGNIVDLIGFIDHATIEMSGASPDGLIGDDGLIEIKCPNASNHLKTLRDGKIKGEYIKQMQWQMACSGRLWCDFVSYNPDFPPELQLKIIRIDRDEEFINMLEQEVIKFLDEVTEYYNSVLKLKG